MGLSFLTATMNQSAFPATGVDGRIVVRCIACSLVQFETKDKRCRRCNLLACVVRRPLHTLPFSTTPLSFKEELYGVGVRIKWLREARSIDQLEFSKLLGGRPSRSYLWRIENKGVLPSVGMLERMSEVLRVPLGVLFLNTDTLMALAYSNYFKEIVPLLHDISYTNLDSIVSSVARLCETLSQSGSV